MAFMESLFRKTDEIDIEEFLNNLDVEEESMYENADAYVKPMTLHSDTDTEAVMEEAKKGNIVLLNISDLAKRNALKLRDLVSGIRGGVEEINGDIARISHDKVLITPANVKIIKRRE